MHLAFYSTDVRDFSLWSDNVKYGSMFKANDETTMNTWGGVGEKGVQLWPAIVIFMVKQWKCNRSLSNYLFDIDLNAQISLTLIIGE